MATLTSCSNLLSSSRNTNDDALAPTLVAGLERGSHDMHVTRAVESVVAAAICHLDQTILNLLALLEVLGRVDKVRRSELARPLLLRVVDINHDDLARVSAGGTLDDTQTDTASSKDGNVVALLDTVLASGDGRGTVAGGNTTSEEAGAVHWGFVGHGHDGDVGNDRVLGEGRAAHEVQEVFALASEARAAIGHHSFTLRGANLAAEVGLAGFAELAFFAFGCAEEGGGMLAVVSC